jgi:hypothetical protein
MYCALAQLFIEHLLEPRTKFIKVEIEDLDAGEHPMNFNGISTCPIIRVVSMGRRNTLLKFTRRSLKT